MTTVVCVLTMNHGKRAGGTCYGPEWLWAIKRRLPDGVPFRYLSDAAPGPWRIPLKHDWPGWWSKIELFRPGLFDGPVLYLDLDTLIVGDLSDLLSYDGPFAMLADLYRIRRGQRVGQSGVMAWTPGPHTEAIYEAYRKAPTKARGDGDFIRDHVEHEYLQDLYPGQIVSLKVEGKHGPPDGARLVAGHGRPRFNDPRAGWAHDEWLAAC